MTTPTITSEVRRTARQAVTYGLVGIVATVVDWGTFVTANHALHLEKHWALTASFLLGAATNFLLNKTITFQNSCRRIDQQIGVYLLIALIVLALSHGCFYLIHERWQLIASPDLSRVAVTFVMYPITFILSKVIIFNPKVIQ